MPRRRNRAAVSQVRDRSHHPAGQRGNRWSVTASPESSAQRSSRSAKLASRWRPCATSERSGPRAALPWATEKRDAQASIAKAAARSRDSSRAAYLIGHEEPLKLLLNQKDPARAGRMFVYYSYFSRERAGEIHSIEANVDPSRGPGHRARRPGRETGGIGEAAADGARQVEQARSHRTVVLANLEAEFPYPGPDLEKLRSQQAGLEKLLHELREAMARYPVDTNSAFGQLRGNWPGPSPGTWWPGSAIHGPAA